MFDHWLIRHHLQAGSGKFHECDSSFACLRTQRLNEEKSVWQHWDEGAHLDVEIDAFLHQQSVEGI